VKNHAMPDFSNSSLRVFPALVKRFCPNRFSTICAFVGVATAMLLFSYLQIAPPDSGAIDFSITLTLTARAGKR